MYVSVSLNYFQRNIKIKSQRSATLIQCIFYPIEFIDIEVQLDQTAFLCALILTDKQ